MPFSKFPSDIFPVVEFDTYTDRLLPMDFTSKNTELTSEVLSDTAAFSEWVDTQLEKHHCRYGIGGYNEHRTIYRISRLFDAEEEPRRLHLGTDIWGKAGTMVYCPIDAKIHSFHFNNHYGDYGATIILEHGLHKDRFYTLYGHLSLHSITGISEGQKIPAGTAFAEFGSAAENGQWPPHLHFQIILDMKGMKGDYPGVCRFSEREQYLQNSPDPNIILSHTFQ